jgi:hypothetical protein
MTERIVASIRRDWLATVFRIVLVAMLGWCAWPFLTWTLLASIAAVWIVVLALTATVLK